MSDDNLFQILDNYISVKYFRHASDMFTTNQNQKGIKRNNMSGGDGSQTYTYTLQSYFIDINDFK